MPTVPHKRSKPFEVFHRAQVPEMLSTSRQTAPRQPAHRFVWRAGQPSRPDAPQAGLGSGWFLTIAPIAAWPWIIGVLSTSSMPFDVMGMESKAQVNRLRYWLP